jgi:hypothetical protein
MVLFFTCIFKVANIHMVTVVTYQQQNYFSISFFLTIRQGGTHGIRSDSETSELRNQLNLCTSYLCFKFIT